MKRHVGRAIRFLVTSVKFLFALLTALLFVVFRSDRIKNIWLIGERFDEARDNGFHFFRYVREHHPEVNVFYVISRKSPDYHRVRSIGPVIEWDSFHHCVYWFLAQRIISAHHGKLAPAGRLYYLASKMDWFGRKSVMLQHGVTAIQVPPFMYRDFERHRVVCVSSAQERKFLIDHCGHDPGSVHLVGLCRFDSLYRSASSRQQVLLMPTWRRWFHRGEFSDPRSEAAQRAFRSSAYFKTFHSLLNSERLHRLLIENDYTLVFYPHYDMQPYLRAFGEFHQRIVVASRQKYDVQSLLKESAILITDFSSVSFDFAFMLKPVIYLLPDEDRFFREHTDRGYFDLRTSGFGPVTITPQEALEALEMVLRNGATMDAAYRARVEGFFDYRDDRNCERTFRCVV